MTEQTSHTQSPPDDEIDLIALAKTVWDSRKFIIKTLVVFVFLGVAVALLTPKEFTASSTMVPQLSGSSNKLGGLSSLAAMAGFELNMNSAPTDLSPYVYPQIVQSVPFQLELMNTAFHFSDVDRPVTLYEYFMEYYKPGFFGTIQKYTIGLPGVIIKAIKGTPQDTSLSLATEGAIRLTVDQDKIRQIVEANVTLETNDKEGYVTLKSTFGEAPLAAEIAQKAQELLQQYITEFKIEKAAAQLDFIQQRYEEKKAEFEKAQAELASFRDRNKNVTSALARTQEERLQSDYTLAFNVYSELAQQLEQAQIKVKEDTPVFSIIKPVVVPIEDNNSGFMTLIIWTFLGGVIAIGWIFGKQFLATVKEKWNQETPPSR